MFAYVLIGILLWAGVASAADPARAPLDLNRATAEELETLPGIGASKASAIVEAREAKGGFSSLEDLEAVRGIGPALMAKLRPLLSVGGAAGGAGGKGAAAKAGAPNPPTATK